MLLAFGAVCVNLFRFKLASFNAGDFGEMPTLDNRAAAPCADVNLARFVVSNGEIANHREGMLNS